MKIAIGVNIFGKFHRQDMCIESLKRIKSLYPDDVDIYNIQPLNNYIEEDGFKTLNVLRGTSKDKVPNSTKDKPMLLEMFNSLGDLNNYDYFIFTNSDIIISDRLIDLIINTKRETYCGSRLTIHDITSLNDDLNPIEYQIAGFDVFCIKSSWWLENKDKFPDYVYAEPCWDVHYATICKKYSDCMLVNKWPANLFHIHHDIAWSDMTPERIYNEKIFFKDYINDCNMWHSYLFNVLLKRDKTGLYCTPHKNEIELEDGYFKGE